MGFPRQEYWGGLPCPPPGDLGTQGSNSGFHNAGGFFMLINAGDPRLTPGSGRSPGKGIGYPHQYSWASLVAQMVKDLPAMWGTGSDTTEQLSLLSYIVKWIDLKLCP